MHSDIKWGMMAGVPLAMILLLIIAVSFNHTRHKDFNDLKTPQPANKKMTKPRFTTDLPHKTPQTENPLSDRYVKIHTVKPGETLYEISLRYLGSTKRINDLLNANPKIKDPNELTPGTKIFVPD